MVNKRIVFFGFMFLGILTTPSGSLLSMAGAEAPSEKTEFTAKKLEVECTDENVVVNGALYYTVHYGGARRPFSSIRFAYNESQGMPWQNGTNDNTHYAYCRHVISFQYVNQYPEDDCSARVLVNHYIPNSVSITFEDHNFKTLAFVDISDCVFKNDDSKIDEYAQKRLDSKAKLKVFKAHISRFFGFSNISFYDSEGKCIGTPRYHKGSDGNFLTDAFNEQDRKEFETTYDFSTLNEIEVDHNRAIEAAAVGAISLVGIESFRRGIQIMKKEQGLLDRCGVSDAKVNPLTKCGLVGFMDIIAEVVVANKPSKR